MKSWVDYITKVDGDNHGWRYVFHFGDWLALDNPVQGAEQVMGATDEEFIANLYYAISAGIVAKAAGVLGYREEQEKYQKLSEEQFAVVQEEYYSATGRCCIKTQTALLLTLKYHLSKNEELTKRQLLKLFEQSNHKLKTGFVGTPLLNNVLTDNGMNDLAYELLLNEEFPGWLYEVKLGATTVWERWNSLLCGRYDFRHQYEQYEPLCLRLHPGMDVPSRCRHQHDGIPSGCQDRTVCTDAELGFEVCRGKI